MWKFGEECMVATGELLVPEKLECFIKLVCLTGLFETLLLIYHTILKKH